MSEWNRRSFLKAGAFGTAGLAIENQRRLMTAVDKPWNARTERSLRKFRDPAPTVCRMCPANCGILAFRDGDRVVQLQGAAGAPTNRGGICARGLAGLERVYDPERQLHPLRRVGPRGSGRWEPISWEHALDQIVEILSDNDAHSTLHLGQEELLVEELRGVLGWREILVDRPLPGRPGPGSGATWYGAPQGFPHTSRARSIYLFGQLPFDGRFQVPLAKDVIEAQHDGAAVHLFHCTEGATGSLAQWHPVTPASEAAVAYGISRLVLKWGNIDREGFARRAVPDGGDADAELQRLAEALDGYTPEAVQQLAGVPAAEVVYLARRFAEERPSLALAPAGSDAAPAAALLNHLVGSVNNVGGMTTARGPFFHRPLHPTSAPEAWLKELVHGGQRTDLYWVNDANPAYDAPETERVRTALADPDRVGLLVAQDTHLTETAALADLFLPLATHLECWGLVEGALPDGRSYLFLQQPVTRAASEPDKLRAPDTQHLSLFEAWARPLGESRGLTDLLLVLSRDRGTRFDAYTDTRAYLGELLRKSWGPGSLEALQNRGVWVSEEGRGMHRVTKVALADTVPTAPEQPTPEQPASEQLFLTVTAPAALARRNPNSRWGREIQHTAELHMHPERAAKLGLRTGNRVRVKSEAGEAVVRLRILQGMHPDSVTLSDGFGHTGWGHVARGGQPPAATADTQAGQPIWWAGSGAGASARALFPFREGHEAVQDWGPLPVQVSKA